MAFFKASKIFKPSGTKSITANGTHDVTDYASASVNVTAVPKISSVLSIGRNYLSITSGKTLNINIVSGNGDEYFLLEFKDVYYIGTPVSGAEILHYGYNNTYAYLLLKVPLSSYSSSNYHITFSDNLPDISTISLFSVNLGIV